MAGFILVLRKSVIVQCGRDGKETNAYGLVAHTLNVIEEFQCSRVKEVVFWHSLHNYIEDRLKQLILDHLSNIKFILEANARSEKL
jgi:sensor domain CHASE-containing protein